MRGQTKYAIAFVCAWLLSASAAAKEPDWQSYNALLQQYVAAGERDGIATNLVDYAGLKEAEEFNVLVQRVRNFDVRQLTSREERLAFFINAYNILTIQLILDHYPVDSIRDIGNFLRGPWDIVMLENREGKLTLDDIEHGILRKLGEPRIHFAVNCASVSCPDLRREPYTAAKLDGQLEDQTRQFLASKGKGLALDGGRARVSRIFDWYEEDFEAGGGVETFVRKHTQHIDFTEVRPNLPYDWQLNAQF